MELVPSHGDGTDYSVHSGSRHARSDGDSARQGLQTGQLTLLSITATADQPLSRRKGPHGSDSSHGVGEELAAVPRACRTVRPAPRHAPSAEVTSCCNTSLAGTSPGSLCGDEMTQDMVAAVFIVGSRIWSSGPVSHGTAVSYGPVTSTWYSAVLVRRRPAHCTASTRARLRWEAPWPPRRCEPPGTAHCASQRRGNPPHRGPVGGVGARSLPWGWGRPLRLQRDAARALHWGPRQARSPDGPAYFAGPHCYSRSATFPKEGVSRI